MKTAVVALGGNAITLPGEEDTIRNQFRRTRQSLAPIVKLIAEGYNLAITHGNGPQVGNAMLRVELARGKAPNLPLGICVADIEGGMGYMIEQSLQNRLILEGIDRSVVTVLTQVVVDKDDPSLSNPTKFIGQFYTREQAKEVADELDWVMKEDSGRGWRQVVPSPEPITIVEKQTIRRLVESGVIVIAAGGGGIPVRVEEDGSYEGVDAVIDKDRASVVLAREIGANLLLILTGVEKVALNFNTPEQIDLDVLTVESAREYLKEGQFPAGSMGDKIEAAIDFVETGGDRVIISSIEKAYEAVAGRTGTLIVKEEKGRRETSRISG
ncbi:MAG: carbamate kinase [Candidatus Glassbacteria bacterium]